MKKYFIEFVGTFFLVLVIGLTAAFPPGAGSLAPVAIGGILIGMSLLVRGGNGYYFNPAFVVAAYFFGKLQLKAIPGYILIQALAGVLAAFSAGFLSEGKILLPRSIPFGPVFLAEFLFSFVLVLSMLSLSSSRSSKNQIYAGIAGGLVMMAGLFSVGKMSFGFFNPAATLGVSLMGISAWGDLWIYLLAHMLGATAAGFGAKLNQSSTN